MAATDETVTQRSNGNSGTAGLEARARVAAELIDYNDLYARWEAGNWSATTLDFSEDRVQWRERFDDFERKAALWNYSLFFWGEDAVTDNLSPYIDAAPLEEQKYFLATQQVDEARHTIFFKRFMHEALGIGDGTAASGLAAIHPQLTWGFRKVFDRLDTMADELRADRSIPKLAQAVTLYHFVVEATLAQPGQHFITQYLNDRGVLPAFCEGMENVARDEQRHIAFGVRLVHDLVKQDPDCKHAIADLLREVMPWTAGVLYPPGGDRRYTTVFGMEVEDLGAEAALSLETKLRAAGVPLEDLPGPPPFPAGLSPRERAERGFRLVEIGMLGEKTHPALRDPDSVALVMDTVRRTVNPDHPLPSGTTLAWDFKDMGPWHLVLDNGSTRMEQGPAPHADLTFRVGYEDWIDMLAGRVQPPRLMLTGRLRPKGSLRTLVALSQVFPKR